MGDPFWNVKLDGRERPSAARLQHSPAVAVDAGTVKLSAKPRSVKPTGKRWQPPEGLAPEEIGAIIDAAATKRDRLLLTTLWATGARISEVLMQQAGYKPTPPVRAT